jgi:hypothetical protein
VVKKRTQNRGLLTVNNFSHFSASKSGMRGTFAEQEFEEPAIASLQELALKARQEPRKFIQAKPETRRRKTIFKIETDLQVNGVEIKTKLEADWQQWLPHYRKQRIKYNSFLTNS